jgi:pimeloyl-ACP methyl ester carboxylesterase
MKDQAQNMVKNGFAVLRYDPPGVGLSTGDSRFETLNDRVQESMAALHYLQTHPDIQPDRVGLWGISPGGWVIGMAAADNPQDVAFLISVSGSGVSVAEQQVWGVETQSRAAGLSESDVSKAALFARLLIDWQLSKPIYQAANQATAAQLGDGPWQDFMKLVYEPGGITPSESLQAGVEILVAVQDEPWTKALYLESVYLPALSRMTPELWADWISNSDGLSDSLLTDPKNFLPKVTSPVLAFFGEDDQLVPAQKSAELYEQYLSQAGNENFKIVVFPNADHGLYGATSDYWKIMSEWLGGLFSG